jgi:hypothetical protein
VENQKVSSEYGLTFTLNDNPMIPMDDIYLHPDFGYLRVEGLADDLPGAINYMNGVLKDFLPTETEFTNAVEKFKDRTMGEDKPKSFRCRIQNNGLRTDNFPVIRRR